MKTNIVVVLDKSGSMHHLTKDTIGGYNNYLQEQKSMALPEDRWSLIQFGSVSEVTHQDLPLDQVPELTPETYRADGGSTSLLDAVWDAIEAAQDDFSVRNLVVINTDGEENSSQRTKLKDLKAKIEEKEKQGNWTFVFLGAGVDAFAASSQMGSMTMMANSVSYAATGQSTNSNWNRVSRSTMAYRTSNLASTERFFQDEEEEDKVTK